MIWKKYQTIITNLTIYVQITQIEPWISLGGTSLVIIASLCDNDLEARYKAWIKKVPILYYFQKQ